MKFIITATVGETDQPDFHCDSMPLLPNIGERVILVTKNAPDYGVVRERSFHYQDNTCSVHLSCDPWEPNAR